MVEFELIDDRPAEPVEVTINIANGVIKLPEDFKKRYLQGRTKKIAFLYNDDGVYIYIKTDDEVYLRNTSYSVPKDGTIINKSLCESILSHLGAPLPDPTNYIYRFTFTPMYEKRLFGYKSQVVITQEEITRLHRTIPAHRFTGLLERYEVNQVELIGKTISTCPYYLNRGRTVYSGGVIITDDTLKLIRQLRVDELEAEGAQVFITEPRRWSWNTVFATFYATCVPYGDSLRGSYEILLKDSFYPRYPIVDPSREFTAFIRRYYGMSPLIEKLQSTSFMVSTRVDPMVCFDINRDAENVYISYLTLDKWYRCKREGIPTSTENMRTKLRFSRFLSKLFPEATSQQIEAAGNVIKGIELVGIDSIKEVTGTDINRVYLGDNYGFNEGTLGNSCMRHSNYQHRINFYANNTNVSCAVLEYNNKILARAIIWTLTDGTKMMDRPYYTLDCYAALFVQYAREKGYKYIYDYRIPKNGKKREDIPVHTTGPDTWLIEYTEKFDVQLDWLPITCEGVTWRQHQSLHDQHYPYFDNFLLVNYKTKILSNLIKVKPPKPNREDIDDINVYNQDDDQYYMFCQVTNAFHTRFDDNGLNTVVECPYDIGISWAHLDIVQWCEVTNCYSTNTSYSNYYASHIPSPKAIFAYKAPGLQDYFLEEDVILREEYMQELTADELIYIETRMQSIDVSAISREFYKMMRIEFSNRNRTTIEEEEEEAVTITSNTNTNE